MKRILSDTEVVDKRSDFMCTEEELKKRERIVEKDCFRQPSRR